MSTLHGFLVHSILPEVDSNMPRSVTHTFGRPSDRVRLNIRGNLAREIDIRYGRKVRYPDPLAPRFTLFLADMFDPGWDRSLEVSLHPTRAKPIERQTNNLSGRIESNHG